MVSVPRTASRSMRYLGEQFGARLIDVAMDQVLQAAGLALQQRQDLVGFAHLPHVVPGRAEHLGAVPYHARRAPRRPPSSARRSTGYASGSAPRGPARRCGNGPVRRGSPAVPQPCPAGMFPRLLYLANWFDQLRGRRTALQALDVDHGRRRSDAAVDRTGARNRKTPGCQRQRDHDSCGPRKVGAAVHWQLDSPMMRSMAGKKGSTQFGSVRQKRRSGSAPAAGDPRAASAGLEPPRVSHNAVVPAGGARYR